MVWMLDLGTAWASSLPNVRTRSRRQRTSEQGGRRVGQQAWAYAGYDRGQETRRQRSTRLGPEQAAGAAVGVEGLGVEPCR